LPLLLQRKSERKRKEKGWRMFGQVRLPFLGSEEESQRKKRGVNGRCSAFVRRTKSTD